MLSLPAALVLGGVAADAHHSISAAYDSSRRVTIEGIVTRFHLVNPHPFLVVDVQDGGGEVQPWRLEMDNLHELAAIGITASTFRSGDRVVVTGSPARSEPHSLYTRRLDRPADGFWYEQVGPNPRVGTNPIRSAR